MLRKLHKLREEFPFQLSSSAPDTRHGLFERQPRQLETELFNNPRRFQAEFSQLEQVLLSEVAHLLCSGFNVSISPVSSEDENDHFLDMGPGQDPIICTATPSNTTAHTVRPYRSDYSLLRAAIN